MPMRELNADPIFLTMMMKLQKEWDTLAKERGLKDVASKIIVDDLLLYGLAYSRTVLDVLKRHHNTLKLKK